jgi:aspartyl-tRNA(Asn)/glutamyl-tRNA(Gln) amidotransferase subunit C
MSAGREKVKVNDPTLNSQRARVLEWGTREVLLSNLETLKPRNFETSKKEAMNVTEKDVAYVADLANLELTPQESLRMVADLNSILGHIDKLNELDTRNVEPLAEVVSAFASAGRQGSEKFAYAQRADEVKPGLSRTAALSNAPDTDGTCFKVPKVIER